MDLLLRFKHWQLFVILIIPSVFLTFSDFASIWNSLSFLVYIGWIYSIGIRMNSLIPENIRPGIKLFKIYCWLLAATYLLVNNFLVYTLAVEHNNVVFSVTFGFVFLFLVINIWMFAARMLESMIEGYLVNRSDALKAFFCFWMFPIGIWYIQPAVQRVLAKYEGNNSLEQGI